jgi:hypothetical protein
MVLDLLYWWFWEIQPLGISPGESGKARRAATVNGKKMMEPRDFKFLKSWATCPNSRIAMFVRFAPASVSASKGDN